MSVLLSSTIHKHECGFPINPVVNTRLAEIASVLAKQNIYTSVFDGQSLSKEEWIDGLKSKQAKIILIEVDLAYFQVLKSLKSVFEKETIVAVCKDPDLINTIIFEYGIDYVYFSENFEGLFQLLQSLSNPFSMFYDHISGIAYKNGLGELTKTLQLDTKSELITLNSDFIPTKSKLYLPFGYQIDTKKEVDIINGADHKVLIDFLSYKKEVNYDSFFLKIPASKKALNKLLYIIENQYVIKNFIVYPSCDVFDDFQMYSLIAKATNLALEKKKAGFFKRILLNIKLNKLI